jgi:hypothetical protein
MLVDVGADGQEVQLQGHVYGPDEIGHEEEGAAKDGHREELLTLVVTGDLRPQFPYTLGDRSGLQKDLAYALIRGLMPAVGAG